MTLNENKGSSTQSLTRTLCPVKNRTELPVSQSQTVRSHDPLAIKLQFGWKTTLEEERKKTSHGCSKIR